MTLKSILTLGLFGLMGMLVTGTSTATPQEMPPKESQNSNSTNISAPGVFVRAVDHDLHVRCFDPQSGGTPEALVIFEHGGGGPFSLEFLDVQRNMAARTNIRSCAYDRHGLGWSPAYDAPFTIAHAVDDLDTIITELQRDDMPTILVGHSLAGFIMRAYTQQHPDTAKGVIYVDPSAVSAFDAYPQVLEFNLQDAAQTPTEAELVNTRRDLMGRLDEIWLQEIEDKKTLINVSYTEKNLRAGDAEKAALVSVIDLMRDTPPLRTLPTTLIIAGTPQIPDWPDFIQADYVSAIDNPKYVTAEGGMHHVHYTHGDLIIDEIVEMVTKLIKQ